MLDSKHNQNERLPIRRGWPAASATGAPGIPAITDRAAWQAGLDALRVREKAHTREGDAIAAARRRLPAVEVDAATPLTGPNGRITLLEVFEGRWQLIAYFHMWFTGQPAARQCEGCTFYNGQVRELSYLHSRDVTYATFSQGPYPESAAYRAFMGYVLVLAFTGAALFTYIAGSSFVFEDLHAVSATTYSLIFATNAVGMLLAGAVFSRLAPRVRLNTLLTAAVLVVATGLRARTFGLAEPAANVHVLRTIDDAQRLSDALQPGRSLTVVGAGFLGLEIASTASQLGVKVTVVYPGVVDTDLFTLPDNEPLHRGRPLHHRRGGRGHHPRGGGGRGAVHLRAGVLCRVRRPEGPGCRRVPGRDGGLRAVEGRVRVGGVADHLGLAAAGGMTARPAVR